MRKSTYTRSALTGIICARQLAALPEFIASEPITSSRRSLVGRELGTIELLSNGDFKKGVEKQSGLSVEVPKAWHRDWKGQGKVALFQVPGGPRTGAACVQIESASLHQVVKVDHGNRYRAVL